MPSAQTSDHLYQKTLDELLKATPFTKPTTIYLALFTTAPNLDGTGGTEVSTSGTAYGRIAIPVASGSWSGPAGSNLEYSNAAELSFNVPTANWGTIVGSGLYDSDIGGTNELLWKATLSPSKQVLLGDGAPKVLIGQLRIARATC